MNISQGISMCNKNIPILDPMQCESRLIPRWHSGVFSPCGMSECKYASDPTCPALVPLALTYEAGLPCSVGIAERSPLSVSNSEICWPTEQTETTASYQQAIRRCITATADIKPGWMHPVPMHHTPSPADSYLGGSSPMSSCSSHRLASVIQTGAPCMTIPTPTELLALETTRSKIGAQDVPDTSRLERKPRRKNAAGRLARSHTRGGTEKTRAVMRAEGKAGKDQARTLSVILGLEATDPDTISVHERKRSYCESLEQYVLYLHEQLRLANHEPAPIERLTEYRGLTSRSIRTLLAHMNSQLEVVDDKIQEAERKFLDLRRQVTEKRFDNRQKQEEPEESGQGKFLSLALQMLDEE